MKMTKRILDNHLINSEGLKLLPEGFVPIDSLDALRMPQNVYIYDPNKDIFHPKYLWSGVSAEKVNEYIEKGLLYGCETG